MSSTASISLTATFESVGLQVNIVAPSSQINTFLDGTLHYRINSGEWLDGHALVDVSATWIALNPYFLSPSTGTLDNWTLHNSATRSGHTVVLAYSSGESAVRQALTGTFNGVYRFWVRVAAFTSGSCEVRVTNGSYPSPTVYLAQAINTGNVLNGKDLYVDFNLTSVTNPTIEVRVANSGDSVTVDWILFGPAGSAASSVFGIRPGDEVEVEAAWNRKARSNDSVVDSGSGAGLLVKNRDGTTRFNKLSSGVTVPSGSGIAVYDATSTERLPVGEAGLVKAIATIDGDTRTYYGLVSRDS